MAFLSAVFVYGPGGQINTWLNRVAFACVALNFVNAATFCGQTKEDLIKQQKPCANVPEVNDVTDHDS